MKKLNLVAMVIAVLALSVSGWGACSNGSWTFGTYASEAGGLHSINGSWCCLNDCTTYYCTNQQLCSSSDFCKRDNFYGTASNSQSGYFSSCDGCLTQQNNTECRVASVSASNKSINLVCSVRCDTQQESDSASCVNSSGTWQDGTCKENHCKAADSTWLSTSIAACTGSNNYAIVNTDSTCEHVGTCCPNDSIPSGNTCKWRCDSVLTTCNGRTGDLFGGVLPDTSVSGQDTTFSYQCYYNCSHSPNPDSTVYLVEGNIVLSGPSDSIPDGIKSETFNSVRTTTGGVYIYDYLSPAASEYIDSIAAMKCVEHLWRCVINNKYVYWYDNQEVPAGCTNIVRVK